MNLQRSTDREPHPALPVPCRGLRCPDRRTCSHHQSLSFAGKFVVVMDRCPTDRTGEPLMFIQCPDHEPLAEPTNWGEEL